MGSEKIISLATKEIFEIAVKHSGENNMPCPECSQTRRKKTAKSFAYNFEKEVGYCNHCNTRFVKYNPYETDKKYERPALEWQNFTKLNDFVVKYFENRKISQKTLLAQQIGAKQEYVPQVQKERLCIMFPFFRAGELVNVKYRDSQKHFKLSSGAELIWYNYDAIQKAITDGKDLVIVEGEIDALSFIQAGYDYVISVPNGANIGKMDYLDSSIDLLSKVKGFILATDNDLKGIELRNELSRRLGAPKCKIANFKQYKDCNELLCEAGSDAVNEVIKTAKAVKLSDIYEVEDFRSEIESFFENGLPQGLKINIPELDEKIRWQSGRMAIVTGTPSSGKSEFVDFVLAKLNTIYNWKIGYYSPESMPLAYHLGRIFPKYVGVEFKKDKVDETDKDEGLDFITENLFWVAPDQDFSVDEILARFEYLVHSRGCKAFVIDPFNRIEVQAMYSTNERLFIKQTLIKIVNFTRKFDALVFVIAHPTKLQKDDKGHFKMPTPYDISGSADFWNMADYNIAVGRTQDADGKFLTFGKVAVQKTKINATLGSTGTWNFAYNINNGRYSTDDSEEIDTWNIQYDNTNWIKLKKYNDKLGIDPKDFTTNLPVEAPPKLPFLDATQSFGSNDDFVITPIDYDDDDEMPF